MLKPSAAETLALQASQTARWLTEQAHRRLSEAGIKVPAEQLKFATSHPATGMQQHGAAGAASGGFGGVFSAAAAAAPSTAGPYGAVQMENSQGSASPNGLAGLAPVPGPNGTAADLGAPAGSWAGQGASASGTSTPGGMAGMSAHL